MQGHKDTQDTGCRNKMYVSQPGGAFMRGPADNMF